MSKEIKDQDVQDLTDSLRKTVDKILKAPPVNTRDVAKFYKSRFKDLFGIDAAKVSVRKQKDGTLKVKVKGELPVK